MTALERLQANVKQHPGQAVGGSERRKAVLEFAWTNYAEQVAALSEESSADDQEDVALNGLVLVIAESLHHSATYAHAT